MDSVLVVTLNEYNQGLAVWDKTHCLSNAYFGVKCPWTQRVRRRLCTLNHVAISVYKSILVLKISGCPFLAGVARSASGRESSPEALPTSALLDCGLLLNTRATFLGPISVGYCAWSVLIMRELALSLGWLGSHFRVLTMRV